MTFPPTRNALTRLAAALPCALALSASAQPAAQAKPRPYPAPPVFTDGGFESPVVGANSFVRFGAGSGIGAWRVARGNVDLIGTGFWQAVEGRQSLDLEGNGPGVIERLFPMRYGGCYTVDFELAGNPDGGPAVKTGYVRVTQGAVGHPAIQENFTFDTTGRTRTDMGYVRQGFHFQALAPTAVLTFGSTTGGGYGPVIDAATVRPAHQSACRLGRS